MYELLYIIPSPFTEKDLPGINKKVKEIITELEGKIQEEKDLGNKKLAYPINQVHKGFYFLIKFEINPQNIPKLDQKLKMSPEILRHLTTKAIKIKPKKEKRSEKKIPKVESFEDIKNVKI
ncbi:30S ribosomal protein S6 [Patescibacteria group bacterium]|nr:30S ribosomal protein S6 [Patescibacteria group bacterium]